MRDRNVVDLDGRGRGKTLTKIYCMRKESIFKKSGKKEKDGWMDG